MSDKLPKVKHNHTLTDILKACIFSLVMMAPITAIGVTCAYVVCNKNAYQSYSGSASEIEKITPVNNVDDLIQNVNYMYVYKETEGTQVARQITFNSISIDWDSYGFPNRNYTSFFTLNSYFYAYYDNYDDVNHREIKQIWGTTLTSFTFNFKSADGTTNLNKGNNQIYLPIFISDSLDNVFYYAVDSMQNNSLFSWTKTTAIYTPVNAMTTGMGINTPAIAVLLVYWLLCTAVYIIIDIVVKGFTWLTHLIGER